MSSEVIRQAREGSLFVAIFWIALLISAFLTLRSIAEFFPLIAASCYSLLLVKQVQEV